MVVSVGSWRGVWVNVLRSPPAACFQKLQEPYLLLLWVFSHSYDTLHHTQTYACSCKSALSIRHDLNFQRGDQSAAAECFSALKACRWNSALLADFLHKPKWGSRFSNYERKVRLLFVSLHQWNGFWYIKWQTSGRIIKWDASFYLHKVEVSEVSNWFTNVKVKMSLIQDFIWSLLLHHIFFEDVEKHLK